MSTSIYHSHHLVPRHCDPEGLFKDYTVKVTIEEHAEIHGLLFDEYWRSEDFVSWLGLSGQISSAPLLGGKVNLGRILTPEHKKRLSEALKGKPKKPFTKSHKDNLAKAKLGNIPWNKGKKLPCSEARRQSLIEYYQKHPKKTHS